MTLRSGMWAVMFTDLAGSTAQRARIGDQAADELRREHDAIVAHAAATRGGHVVKGTGDGSMAVFAGAADAVDAAIAIEQGVELRNRNDAEPLGLRVGISLGDLAHENGDLFGLAVNEAARLCALAEAGEILLSELVRAVSASRLSNDLVDRGHHALKGFPEPVRVWAASWEPAGEVEAIKLPPALAIASDAMSFAGRSSELGELLSVLNRSLSGTRELVLLSGEPGIGKTRLASEIGRRAYEAGALVLYGHCDDEAAAPYQPFTEAVDWYFGSAGPDLVLGESPAELARLSLRAKERFAAPREPPASDAETAQYRLFDAIGSWLGALASQHPVVVVLDDLHWASKPTLLMLKHLLRTIPQSRLFIVATYRDTDLDRQHPLGLMLAELGRFTGVQRIDLSGLDEQSIEALVESATERPIDTATRELSRALHSETRGNAFFIGEVLRHLLDTGELDEQVAAAAGARPADRVVIPQGVKAILGERLTRLGDTITQVLRAAAVVGRDFDVRLVAAASGLDEHEVLDALDRALGARLVEDAGRGLFRFSHALVRAALLDELSTARRMRIHQLIAATLETIRPDDLVALANHWCEAATAGDPLHAIDVSRRAATQACERAAFEEAVQLLERAVDLLVETADDPDLASLLLLDLGDARMDAGSIESARDAYLAAADRPDAASEVVVRAALSFHGPPSVESFDGRHEPLIRRALGGLDPVASRDLCAQLHAALALRLDDDDARTPEEVALAVELGSASSDPRTRLELHKARFWVACGPGGGALHVAQGALRAAEDLGSVSEQLAALELCMIASTQLGGNAAATEYVDRHRRIVAESHLRHFLDFQNSIDARWRLSAGDHHGAVDLVRSRLETDPNEYNTLAWASISAQQMRLTDRHAELAQSLRDWTGAGLIPRGVRTYVNVSMALALADSGQLDEAREVFAVAAENQFACLQPVNTFGRPVELAMLASACAALGEAEHASSLFELVEPWAGEHLQLTMGEYCGPATLFLGRLERTRGRANEAVACLTRAVAEAQAADVPLNVAEARLELARTLAERGVGDDLADARSLTDEARRFALDHDIAYFVRQADEIDATLRAV